MMVSFPHAVVSRSAPFPGGSIIELSVIDA
jgi:hypothetical protein